MKHILIIVLFFLPFSARAQIEFGRQLLGTSEWPRKIDHFDLDADSDPDIIGVSFNELYIWINNGKNNYRRIQVTSGNYRFEDVKAADIDNDSDIDLITTSSSNSKELALWLNDGSLNFTKQVLYSNKNFKGIGVGHLDNDNLIDIVVSTSFDNYLYCFMNQGAASFDLGYTSFLNNPQYLDIGDLDKDGDNDIVVAAYNNSDVIMYENDGSSNFVKHILSPGIGNVIDTKFLDFNKDGYLDILATGKSSAAGLRIYLNKKNIPQFDTLTVAWKSFDVSDFGDLDMDNDIDFIGFKSGITYYYINENNSFKEYTLESPKDIHTIDIVDLDQDKQMDFLMGGNVKDEFSLYRACLESIKVAIVL